MSHHHHHAHTESATSEAQANEALQQQRAHDAVDRAVDRTQELLEQGSDPQEVLETARREGYLPEDVIPLANAAEAPIEALTTDFDQLALEDENLEPLTAEQEASLVKSIHQDHAGVVQQAASTGALASLASDVPMDLPVSPSQMFEHDVNYLQDPMPAFNPDGTPMTRRHEQMGEPLGSPEDHAAINAYLQGKSKELTDYQKELLTNQLLRTGALGDKFKNMSSSEALNSLFNDIKRMQAFAKRNPVTFGFRVPLKSRKSKTRDKKKAKRK
jgi:hypothetical protein